MQGSSEKICDTRFLLRNIENRLLSYGNESARLDARCILGLVLGRDNPVLPHEDIDNLSEYQTQYLEEILSRRINGEPISRIRGWRGFWSLRFSISPDTLDPRPDSEILVEAAYNWLSARYPDEQKMRARAPYCLDIGTGSGCLHLALISELPFVTGLGTDLSRNAIQLLVKMLQSRLVHWG